MRGNLGLMLGSLLVFQSSASSCGDAICHVGPCPMPSAFQVTVRSAATGAPVLNAFFVVNGDASGGGPCQDGTCAFMSYAGTYEVDVIAPGYRSTHRSIVVPGENPKCGCRTAELQRVTVALTPEG
jgi:hypothetical protein